jgi:hypothetical protein
VNDGNFELIVVKPPEPTGTHQLSLRLLSDKQRSESDGTSATFVSNNEPVRASQPDHAQPAKTGRQKKGTDANGTLLKKRKAAPADESSDGENTSPNRNADAKPASKARKSKADATSDADELEHAVRQQLAHDEVLPTKRGSTVKKRKGRGGTAADD